MDFELGLEPGLSGFSWFSGDIGIIEFIMQDVLRCCILSNDCVVSTTACEVVAALKFGV